MLRQPEPTFSMSTISSGTRVPSGCEDETLPAPGLVLPCASTAPCPACPGVPSGSLRAARDPSRPGHAWQLSPRLEPAPAFGIRGPAALRLAR